MMKSTSVASGGIVHQVLDIDNYERWKGVMQNYLQGQGLWDVIFLDAIVDTDTDYQVSEKMKHGKASPGKKISSLDPINPSSIDSTGSMIDSTFRTDLEKGHRYPRDSSSFSRTINDSYSTAVNKAMKGSYSSAVDKAMKGSFSSVVEKGIKTSVTQSRPLISRPIEEPVKAKHPQDHHESKLDMHQGGSQDLSEVETNLSEVEAKASWKRMDAKALHIIKISCGKKIVDEISHFQSAKEAWIHLSLQYGKELRARAGTQQDVLQDSLIQHKEVFRRVEQGEFIGNINMDSDVYMTYDSGRTLLHAAVITGNVKNVKMLVKVGKDKLVAMQDHYGYTALALVARDSGNTDIAKCMLEIKNETLVQLLKMENKDKITPILLAAANGHKELTTYLYSKTPSGVFDGPDSQKRSLLLSLCIAAEIFDVALRLLKRYENLSRESIPLYGLTQVPASLRESLSIPTQILEEDPTNQSLTHIFSALVALAKTPSAFPSGTKFGRPKQFIYDTLSVEREFADNYGIPNIAKYVQKVTRVAAVAGEEKPPKINLFGRLPRIFRGIAYLFIQSFKCLNIFGVRKIYDQKYAHYKVIGILSYFSQGIGEFDGFTLEKALAYEAMLHAAQHGIIEFINAMREANPNLLTAVDSCDRGIFSYAIQYRKQNVFQLIHSLHGQEILRSRKDAFNNNLLHLAAHLGPSSDRDSKSGAALQMQRQLQWFKAVEKVVHPKFKEAKNFDGKKPYEIFTENHEELMKAGEKWAKDTATSYTIVGTLITTIMFAAFFTVPGGNNQETGLPIFLHDNIFTAFLLADAISLFASATSVLIFIGILTSRYAEKDFLKRLPWKLLWGLFFISLSVCSMIVAFCAAIIDMILKGYGTHKWFIAVPIMPLGSIPIIILLISQMSFMYEIFRSTWKNPIRSIKK